MPIYANFPLVSYADGLLSISMRPPTNIAGWNIQVQFLPRYGASSGLITKSCASGYGGGQSGVTVLNSGNGQFSIDVWSRDTSGFDAKNYYYSARRLDSGYAATLAEGFLVLTP